MGTPPPVQRQAEGRKRDTTERSRCGLSDLRKRIKADQFKVQLDYSARTQVTELSFCYFARKWLEGIQDCRSQPALLNSLASHSAAEHRIWAHTPISDLV